MKKKSKNITGFFARHFMPVLIVIGIFSIAGLISFLIFDKVLMPEYTRLGKEFPVPDIKGYKVDQAARILSSEGFVLSEEISEKIDYERPAGEIVEQYPKSGSRCKEGRKVYVTVSKGALPVIVPKLIGLSPRDAEYRISESKLFLDTVFYEFSTEIPEGVVMGQSLVVNDSAAIGDSLFMVISSGKHPSEFVIPDLKGENLEKAAELINKSGFTISEVVYMKDEELLPRTVIDQKPAAGEIVYQGTPLRLLVSVLIHPDSLDVKKPESPDKTEEIKSILE